MKTILKLTALSAILLILAGALISCRDKEQPFLTVDETPITAPAEGGTFSIATNSNGNWVAIVEDPEWCTLTVSNDTIVVTVAPNTDFTTRSTTITIILRDLTKVVVVNQEAMLGGRVPFQPCRCEFGLFPYQVPQGKAYLFRNHRITQEMIDYIELKINTYPFPVVTWIMDFEEDGIMYIFMCNLDPNANTERFRNMVDPSHWRGEVCNFPDFAREWNIPPDGIKVYFEGRAYHSCLEWGASIDYVLTYLKKIEK